MRFLPILFGITFGVAGIILGGLDDSPGLQGLGLLLLIFTIVRFIRKH